jgi:hypothetical protein
VPLVILHLPVSRFYLEFMRLPNLLRFATLKLQPFVIKALLLPLPLSLAFKFHLSTALELFFGLTAHKL